MSPHADGLASALNVWGLAVMVRANRSHRRVLLAALLFTLAWSAKITTVFGFAAAFVWLMSTGFPAMAWELAAETCCGYLLVGAVLFVGSQGRFWEIFKACASGGTSLAGFASGPLNMLVLAARLDPGALLFLLLALVVLVYAIFSGKSAAEFAGLAADRGLWRSRRSFMVLRGSMKTTYWTCRWLP